MYQALYRKYRPSTFISVVGQEHVTKVLKNQIITNRVSHAYMFTGTRGTGKTSCAKILARAVNCLNPIDGDPCNLCVSCLSIINESCLDVSEIDAASNNKVDDIRDILEETKYTPSSVKKRVFIIDEVHMLTVQAFNALLKTLEEPPEHVLFILATTDIHKVLPTVLSRCQRFDFKRINSCTISKTLIDTAQKEGFELEQNGADIIAKLADGGLRDALSILDRCITTENTKITAQDVCQKVGSLDFTKIIELSSYIINYDTTNAIKTIDDMYNSGIELKSMLEQVLALFRDMLLYNITKDENYGILYDSNNFKENCKNISSERLSNYITVISNSLNIVQKSQNKKIDVELCIIKLCKNIMVDSNLSDRIACIEEKISNTKQISIQQKTVNTEPKPKIEPKIVAKMPDIEGEKGVEDFDKWTDLLRNLKHIYKNRELIFLRENALGYFYSNKIVAVVDDEITYQMLNKIEIKQKIAQKATEIFKTNLDFDVSYKNAQIKGDLPIDDILNVAKTKNIAIKHMED